MEWISVNDRLPEEGKDVVVWLGYIYAINGLVNGEWWDDEYANTRTKEVTHWAILTPPTN